MLDLAISVVLAIVNGMFWYSPSIGFGSLWAANAWPGKSMEWIASTQTHSEGMYAVCIVSHCISMLMFKILAREIRPLRFSEYISLALIIAMMVFALRLVHLPFESSPLVLILIDTGYDMVNLLLSAIIQYSLRK